MKKLKKIINEIIEMIAFKLEKFANDLENSRWCNVKKRIENEFKNKNN